jgi:hypothetical protein
LTALTVRPGAIKNGALDLCRRVASVLQTKVSAEEADGYKRWLLGVGQRVAEASKEGGVLGFGGVLVSESEADALSEIAAALEIQL